LQSKEKLEKTLPNLGKWLNLDGDVNLLYEHHSGGPDRRAYQVIRGLLRPFITLARFYFDRDNDKASPNTDTITHRP